MGIRFVMGVNLNPPENLSGTFLEGRVIISYTLAGDDPEVRLYFQHGSSRMPLVGTDRDIATMFGIDSDDLNTVFDQLEQPGQTQLLAEFQCQGRNRRSIERTLEGPYLVRTRMDLERGVSSATKYKAEAPTPQQRADYARVRDDILSRMARVQAKIQVASASSLREIQEMVSSSACADDYASFTSRIKAEHAAVADTATAIMRIRSDFRRFHDYGYVALERYKNQQVDLYVALTETVVQPLLNAMNSGAHKISTYVLANTLLDVSRFQTVAQLADHTHALAKEIYRDFYDNDPAFSRYVGTLAGTARLAQGFTGHAEKIQWGIDAVAKQRRRLEKARGPQQLRQEKSKALRLAAGCQETVQQNSTLLRDVNVEGNSFGLDKLKSLLLIKMEELDHHAVDLRRAYSL